MKRYGKWVALAAVVLCVLTFAFQSGGSPQKYAESTVRPTAAQQTSVPTATAYTIEKTETREEQPKEEVVLEEKAQDMAQQTTEQPSKQEPATPYPEQTETTKKQDSCTLSVSCKTLLTHMDSLEDAKKGLVPKNGIILAPVEVAFHEGESVFDVLQRTLRNAGIQMEFVNTPAYHSSYIEGIANLYEYDCGELSGWVYSVNGIFPQVGCSNYILKSGDRVEWFYSCDLGRDVGNEAVG